MKKGMNLAALTTAFRADVWAIEERAFDVVAQVVMERMAGNRPSAEQLAERLAGTSYGAFTVPTGEQAEDGPRVQLLPLGQDAGTVGGPTPALAAPAGSSVAVVPLHGVLISRAGFMDMISGATSPQMFADDVRRAADDPSVGAVVLDMDTPGGTVAGTDTAAQAVAYAAARKPVYAVANESAYSAGMWIAAQASRVIVPSGGNLGSIGVIATHRDYTQQLAQQGIKPTVFRSTPDKALGQREEALTDASSAKLQAKIDEMHAAFVHAIAQGRGITAEQAAALATGDTWRGQAAVDAGLADAVGNLPDVLAALLRGDEYPPTREATAAPAAGQQQPAAAQGAGQGAQAAHGAAQGPQDAPTPPPGAQVPGTLHAQEDKTVDEIMKALAAGEQLNAAQWATLAQHAQAQAAAPQVNEDSLDPAVRALLDAERARANAAEQRAAQDAATAAQAVERETAARYEAEARQLGQPAAFGAALREADEKLSPAAAAAVRTAASATTARAELAERTAAELAKDPTLSRFAANERVFAADPGLRARYMQEVRSRA